MEMAREYHYKPDSFPEYVDQFARKSMQAIEEFDFDDEKKINLLMRVKENVVSMLELDKKLMKRENEVSEDETI